MLVLLASFSIFFAAPGPTPEAVERASAHAYENSSYQRELPIAAQPKQGEAGKRRPMRRRPPPKRRSSDSTLGQISNALLWLLTFVILAVFALWFVREFLGYMPDAEAELEAAVLEQGQSNTVVSAPLQDARALAQRAQYGEAIHALLLRTLMELGRTYSEPLAPSLTSREILEALQLSTQAHEALTGLIVAVELCHFRGSAPDQADYARCLGHFEVFARAYVKESA